MSSIGSDKARVWARELVLGKCSAKAVLLAIGNYVDEDGHCWPSASTLARDTDQTEGNVRRLLKWLENVGVIVRIKRWRTEQGMVTYDPNGGRQTSDEIRLCMKVSQTEINARIGERGGGSDDDADEAISLCKIDRQPGQPSVGCVAEGAYAPVHTLEESLQEREESPLPPKGGGPQRIDEIESEAKDWPGSDTWPDFERAWSEPILRQSIGRQVWSALTPAERELAVTAARGYVLWRRSQKKPPNVINAHTFLRETDAWAGFARQVPPEVVQVDPLFVPEGSDAWRAMCVLAAIGDESPPVARNVDGHGRGILRFKPLSPQRLALATFADPAGKVDTLEWRIVKSGTNQCGAWRVLTGHEPINVWTGETKRMVVAGKVYENWKVMIAGLRVPCEWPPRKDGSLCTGPPPGQLTDEDAKAFIEEN